ncbi:MAG: tRNA uridine-5-carboxymethylaminomethyl(34) synthesis GTPase MnmE [Anaeroplasmataceae bacterium]|nr:tRNA uridine-5-carboxymethylaminomethyl(34) synthesis GTPase MnmE [Anaeroplasmataceae bacterium]MDE6413970.1 tRNA uridine-5-carboxymethylaminomethyl(34) synthesis GTPase MnmE [Anaeroplasmataceae bacterium]
MTDNICALATPYGTGAIAIIRCSGPEAISLVNKIFKGQDLTKVLSHTIHYGHIMNGKEVVDEVLCNVFISPKSFDGENMVEINCHGGILVTNKIIQVLLRNGFRLAEPGEFSKRAFLNKRVDLTQAEAIMDIIHAENSIALKAGQNSLKQSTTKLIHKFRDQLLDILAKIEVNIDYPEYEDSITVTQEYLLPVLIEMQKDMNEILKNSSITNLAIHGIKTAIVGKPNVGKSSLLNMLLEEDKAIVTDIPGTTRDLVEGSLTIGNLTLHLIDTAGIRKSEDIVEQIGIERSAAAIEQADLVLVVFDASHPLDEEDKSLLKLTEDKSRILVGNKIDKTQKLFLENMVLISAKEKLGVEALADAIIKETSLDQIDIDEGKFLVNQRQIHLMERAEVALKQAYQACLDGLDVDLIEIDLKQAFDDLGAITGESTPEELITALFTKFCLGK